MHTMRDCIDNDNKEIALNKMKNHQNAACATLEMRNLWIARESLLTIHLLTRQLPRQSLLSMLSSISLLNPSAHKPIPRQSLLTTLLTVCLQVSTDPGLRRRAAAKIHLLGDPPDVALGEHLPTMGDIKISWNRSPTGQFPQLLPPAPKWLTGWNQYIRTVVYSLVTEPLVVLRGAPEVRSELPADWPSLCIGLHCTHWPSLHSLTFTHWPSLH